MSGAALDESAPQSRDERITRYLHAQGITHALCPTDEALFFFFNRGTYWQSAAIGTVWDFILPIAADRERFLSIERDGWTLRWSYCPAWRWESRWGRA